MTSTSSAGRRAKGSVAIALAAALGAAGLLVGMSPAAAESDPAPIAVTPLTTRAAFPDDVSLKIRNRVAGRSTDVHNLKDASNMVVAEVVIQPGESFPWHTHPGPVLISIVSGDFTYVVGDDCVRRDYAPGEALVDGGVDAHTAFNDGDVQTVVIATFLDAPDAGPLTIPVDVEQMIALDDTCGLTTPRPAS